jgi:hypothetical protein
MGGEVHFLLLARDFNGLNKEILRSKICLS